MSKVSVSSNSKDTMYSTASNLSLTNWIKFSSLVSVEKGKSPRIWKLQWIRTFDGNNLQTGDYAHNSSTHIMTIRQHFKESVEDYSESLKMLCIYIEACNQKYQHNEAKVLINNSKSKLVNTVRKDLKNQKISFSSNWNGVRLS